MGRVGREQATRQAGARWRTALQLILPGLLLAGVLLAKLAEPTPVLQIQRAGFDTLQRLSPRAPADVPLRVVEIDDESLARYGQWPWPRSRMAELLDRLRASGAALVVLDMVFAEPDRTAPARLWDEPSLAEKLRAAGLAPGDLPDGDSRLAAAMRAIPTVLGFAFSDEESAGTPPPRPAGYGFSGPDPTPHLRAYRSAIRDLPVFEQEAAGYGSLNGLTDSDGVERRIPLMSAAFGELYPSLVGETLRLIAGGDLYQLKTAGGSGERSFGADTGVVSLRVGAGASAVTVPTDAAGAVALHLGPLEPSLPAWRLLAGTTPAQELDGRLVLVAVSATGIGDLRPTALGLEPSFALHANALAQIMLGDYLTRPDWARGAELFVMLLLGLVLILLAPRLPPLGSALLATVLILALVATSWVAYAHWHLLLDGAVTSLALAVLFLVSTVQSFFLVERQRAFIHHAFARYLSADLVDELAKNPQQLRLGGERRELTFLFTDIAGFTTLSETLGPVALAPILNGYFDHACSIILAHGGMVNEFVGDAILAFFGAPITQRDHAERAVACARELDRFTMAFHREQVAGGIAFGMTRIGLHTGTALIGNFGSQKRFKYAALGDVVNTASRIEGLNKHFGTRVCLSGDTAVAAGASGLRPLGRVIVKGRTQALAVLELPDSARATPDGLARYGEAYAALVGGDAARARELFDRLHAADPEDGAVAFHVRRLERGESGDLIVMDEK